MGKKINDAFHEIEASLYFDLIKQNIKKEILSNSEEYILGVNTDDYCDYLFVKYFIDPFSIDLDNPEIVQGDHRQKRRECYQFGFPEEYVYNEYDFYLYFQYQGDLDILRIEPSQGYSFSLSTRKSPISIEWNQSIKLTITIYEQNKEEFERTKQAVLHSTFMNLDRVNNEVRQFNEQLPLMVRSILSDVRQHYQKENDFLASINASKSIRSTNSYKVPVIESRVTAPTSPNSKQKVPYIEDALYQRILRYIDLTYKGYERLPSNYKGREEEDLRDSVLPHLQAQFTNCTTTGETFNKNGKTDICIKYTDGTNVFIGECKFWRGEQPFAAAINQLFDRYITWDDTKVALIVFVQNDGFTEVISKAKAAIKQHPYFMRTVHENNQEHRGSYIFHHAEDPQRHIKLELMLYHFNQK